MKFEIKQEKFQNMLEKLLFKDMFGSSIICFGKKKVFSIQREEAARALRFVKFEEPYFESIDDEEMAIEIDTKKVLNLVKKILPGSIVTVSVQKNKFSIKSEKADIRLSYKEPEPKDVLKELTFTFDKGVPVIGEQKIPLDTHFTMDIKDFKDIGDYGSTINTDFYKFSFNKDKIEVRIGDLHEFSDYVLFTPNGEIKKGDLTEVIFTYGIQQIAATFENIVEVRTKTNSPAWLYEGTKEYVMGVLLPPYINEE